MRLFLSVLIWAGTIYAAYVPEARPLHELPFRGVKLADHFQGTRNNAPILFYTGKGAWDVDLENLKNFFQQYQLSYDTAVASDILGDYLAKKHPSVILMPGGESWTYLAELGTSGGEKIKNFVNEGGGYIGICAGSFYAVSNRDGGQATGPYGIGLLEGTAYDGEAHETPPFVDGPMDFEMVLDNPIVVGVQKITRMLLYGGPSFRFTADEQAKKDIQVLARFPKVEEPAMITFHFGQGHVFLSAPHLEVKDDSEDSDDPRDYSEWPLLEKAVEFVMGKP